MKARRKDLEYYTEEREYAGRGRVRTEGRGDPEFIPSLEQYDRVLQSLPNGLVLIDRRGKIVQVNAQLEALFGYRKEELLGKSVETLMPERFRARHRGHVSDFMADPHIRPMGSGLDLFGLRKDGTEFSLDISLSYLPAAGEIVAMAVVRDVSQRKNIELSIDLNYRIQKAVSSVLRISLEPDTLDEQLSRVLDLVLTIPSFAMRARGSIYLAEQAPGVLMLRAMHGFTVAQVASCKTVPLGQGMSPHDEESCQIVATSCLEIPREIQYTYTASVAGGLYCVPILFGDQALGIINVAVAGSHQRLSEEEEFLVAIANALAGLIVRRQAEVEKNRLREQLIESERLAALGRIAANVSHTIKNPLMAIGGFANRLFDMMPEGTKEKKYAGLIFEESVRLENVLQNVLLFSRRDADVRMACSLREIVEKALIMYEDVCRERSVAVISRAGDVPAVAGNREQMLQAVENLLSNAVDAMTGGGTLTISTHPEQVRGRTYAAVTVQDTGSGISAENLNRIFEPFFTTKLILKGTGLGLSITKKVVEGHGGFIDVDSTLGTGTSFTLYFPASSKQ